MDDRRLLLDSLSASLDGAVSNTLERKKLIFEKSLKHIEALNPISIISRGYSAVFAKDGSLVKSVDSINIGDEVSFRTTDGIAEARITAKRKENI